LSIPYRDTANVEELGPAAFLKFEPGSSGSELLAALFLVSARGEPIEFAYNRIETPHTFLWRPTDLRRHVERKLTASLLDSCERTPSILLCLADEVGSELFCQDIHVSVPVGRIGDPLQATPHAAAEFRELLDELPNLHVFWYPSSPAADSVERRLFANLASHGLLLEPFERASLGLREVYASTGAPPAPLLDRSPGSGRNRPASGHRGLPEP
jgi:hypothetical protein